MNRGGHSQGRGRGGGTGGPNTGGGQSKKLGDDEYTKGAVVEPPFGQETALDMTVMRKENGVVKSNQDLSLDTLVLTDIELPIRPGYGNDGKKIVLKTNYFRMKIDPSKSLFKYEVKIDSNKGQKRQVEGDEKTEAIGRRVRQRAFALLFGASDFRSLGDGLATDFAKTIITTRRLELGAKDSKIYQVVYREAEETVPRPNPTTYTFRVSFEGSLPIDNLLNHPTATDSADFPGKADAIQALNIVIARSPNNDPNIFQAGQNKFFHYPTDQKDYLDLTGGLIAVRGFYSSVRCSTLRTLLNLNSQCSPFYPAVNMCNLMDQHCKWVEDKWQALNSFIDKLRVKIQYLKNKDGTPDVRVKTAVGLSHKFGEVTNSTTGTVQRYGNAEYDHGDSTQLSFECSEFPQDGLITIEKYFHKKHNIRLKNPQAWVLNCGTSQNPIWIPPELCQIMPGQPFHGLLSEKQTTNMLKVAARPPAENARRIVGRGQDIMGIEPQNPGLAAFGVNVGRDMILVAGRVLDGTPVLYKKNAALTTVGASWNMINKNFAVPGRVSKWSFLALGNTAFSNTYLDQFRTALRATGMGEETPMTPPGSSRPGYHVTLSENEENNDKSIMNAFRAMKQHGVRYLLVILPLRSQVLYSRVKFWADVKAGIHTVCAVKDKLSKGPNYYANIALKFNLKCGGVNHLIPEKNLKFLAEKTTMVVGIDVTHPAPKSMKGAPSIAGVVASVDQMYGQWPGNVRCQKGRQEMVQDLDIMMRERLDLWREKNGKLPEKILIYRDGVSEGQYKIVLNEELSKIRQACNIYGSDTQPKITIVVVGKRHHTRFYPTKQEDADRKGNPKNGTVVDRGITMEKGFDFFLQAHTSLQGTAKPAHYVIILDEMKLGADEIQGLTHHLCYLYGRATKAVSVCPPAYYADILCERGRCYLAKYLNARWPPGKEFDENEAPWYQGGVALSLRNTMFYI